AYTQVVEVFLAAQFAEPVPRQFALLGLQVVPQVEVGEEVRFLLGEPGVGLLGLLLFVGGAFAGSWMDSAEVMTRTSPRQSRFSASRIMRPSRGSTGSWARLRPILVRRRLPAEVSGCRAPSSLRRLTPSLIWR